MRRAGAALSRLEHTTDDATPVRCTCGNLLAYRTARGVEIKCRRCKRVVGVVPLDAPGDGTRSPPDS